MSRMFFWDTVYDFLQFILREMWNIGRVYYVKCLWSAHLLTGGRRRLKIQSKDVLLISRLVIALFSALIDVSVFYVFNLGICS